MLSTKRLRRPHVARCSFWTLGLSLLLMPGLTHSVLAQTPDPAEIVAAHNKWRAEVAAPAIAWSPEVAASAARWAQELQGRACAVDHSSQDQRPGMGENLYWGSALMGSGGDSVADTSSTAVVDSWGSEKEFYDVSSNSCRNGVCGHYTQVVWARTREVGCAAVACADKSQIWVCQYRPGGNVMGERPF
jgi:pathogenesis-related protein 1